MNYVELNGIRSTLIRGLLIQSLPPVSKPLMRTRVEEIDGMDGDIITRLGYSAYDKDVLIGLYGKFDVDEVIRYFESSGRVIFSNEPNKYYNYEILEQIDFERLIRFRTATVTFHVQPYKYSAIDKPLQLLTSGKTQFNVSNFGNIISRPTLTVHGTGNIGITLNGSQILTIAMGSDDFIVIDSAQMNAYKDGILKNRQVTGSYDNLAFGIGNNVIEWSGNLTELDVDNYSRWI